MVKSALVAILRDEGGRVTDARTAVVARLCAREDGAWGTVGEVPVGHTGDAMESVRRDVRALIGALGECRIVVARGLTGVAYGAFDRMGFHIFDASEADGETLDGVLRDIEAADEEARVRRETLESARPVQTGGEGIYYLDLVLLQRQCPEVSSKRALRGFLKDTPFLELHLICSHAPPWLEETGFHMETAGRPDGNLHLILTPGGCRGQ